MPDQRMRPVMLSRGSLQTNAQLKVPPQRQDCGWQAFSEWFRVDEAGFKSTVEDINHDASVAEQFPITLHLGSVSESVVVTAEAATVNTETTNLALNGRNYTQLQQLEANAEKQEQNAASAHVMNLQRRVAGVQPAAIEVPRTGTSFQFVRPLVLDEETKVTFSYRSKQPVS
jgi:hypothetical protein